MRDLRHLKGLAMTLGCVQRAGVTGPDGGVIGGRKCRSGGEKEGGGGWRRACWRCQPTEFTVGTTTKTGPRRGPRGKGRCALRWPLLPQEYVRTYYGPVLLMLDPPPRNADRSESVTGPPRLMRAGVSLSLQPSPDRRAAIGRDDQG
ncbi:hypothetical protein BO71DRAFT_109577 [Aspergillus ellipticus CBS 707.79]|uniref:Uncharacterized protein n=1 Tax=Aspergillus ellipticus CBS 707.79 TaxID=1448320 RepID=A0A319D4G7_9EURO|nr:hypothetical protein BO71DRAFT_109577 [Aspergillus ellipticus CBS 707.79]